MPVTSAPNHIIIPEIKKLIDEGHTVTLRVRGVSMRPFLDDGRDCVLLAPCEDKANLHRGDIVLAEVFPKQYVLHRIERIEGDRLTLRGDGNLIGREGCRTTDVIAIVTAFYRKGRKKADLTDGWKWRIYSALWPDSFLARRILLACYRHIVLRIFPSRTN
ncbi:MAG: S24/S26 family peptidase [Alloprevotella sp.]|nr:S24/S26 family peptidase [Alloprevotella sp.]